MKLNKRTAPTKCRGTIARVRKNYHQMTMKEMLEASKIISFYIKSGKLELTGSSFSVSKYVTAVTIGKQLSETEAELRKLNHDIVRRNASENRPTAETIKIYEKLIQDD